MPLTTGSTPMKEVYFGSDAIKEIYSGSDLIWKNAAWPQTGSAQITTVNNALSTVYTFTAEEPGQYQFDLSISGDSGMLNVAIAHPGGRATGRLATNGGTATVTWTGNLAPGQQVELMVVNTDAPATASWAIEWLGNVVAQPFSYNFQFNTSDELKWSPLSNFDGRTDSTVIRNSGFLFNGMFVAGDNPRPAYNNRLVNRQIDGDTCTWEFRFGDVMNVRDRPASIVLASNIDQTDMLVIGFGSNGYHRLQTTNGVISDTNQANRTLRSGDVITVTRTGNSISVKHNGADWATFTPENASSFFGVPGRCYTGFGTYSTGGTWASRLDYFTISGTTSYVEENVATEAVRRIQVPRNNWTEVAAILAAKDMEVRCEMDAKWAQASSSSNRQFRIKVDGVVIGTTANEGTYLITAPRKILANQFVTLEALSASGTASYRDVTNGTLRMFP